MSRPSDYCTAYPVADFIRMRFSTDPQAETPPLRYRSVPGSTIYGPESTAGTLQSSPAAERPLTDSALFQGFVLLLGVAYVLLVYQNLPDLRTLLNHVLRNPRSDKRTFQEPSGSRYARFLYTATVIGLLFAGVMAVKYCPPAAAAPLFGRLSFAAALGLSLSVSAACIVMLGLQWALLRIVGFLTLTQPLLAQLRQLRMRYFAASVMLVTPALLLFALCPPHTGRLWFGLMIIGLAVTFFLYLRETSTLFLAKKVSFVHWFLYLCGVELFPVSLLWQLATR